MSPKRGRPTGRNRKLRLLEDKGRVAARELVLESRRQLEEPLLDEDMQGHQLHFLDRLKRLDEAPRQLATELYEARQIRHFIARFALGLPPFPVGFAEEPKNLEERRIVIDLEPGMISSRLILDGRGKPVTCLAADMPIANGTRVSHARFKELFQHALTFTRFNELSHKAATQFDLFAISREVRAQGWLTPRETVLVLISLGHAGSVFLITLQQEALKQLALTYRRVFMKGASGPQNDQRFVEWFTATGELAVYSAALAALRIEPPLEQAITVLRSHDLISAMVFGACLFHWRPVGAEGFVGQQISDEDVALYPFSAQVAMLFYYGLQARTSRAQGLRLPHDHPTWEYFDQHFKTYDAEFQELRRLGLPENPLVTFSRGLSLYIRGKTPDWPDELAPNTDDLPPLLLEDLCLPDRTSSFKVLRLLARRLLSFNDEPIYQTLFLPRERLHEHCPDLDPLSRVRKGDFTAPWLRPEEVVTPRSALPGRNDACPCGSGKKFKKCCLEKLSKELNVK